MSRSTLRMNGCIPLTRKRNLQSAFMEPLPRASLRTRVRTESACINRLMALEGAIRGVKKNQLPDDIKADLKDFYQLKKK